VTLTTQNHPILTFCITFHVFLVSGDRDFKFGSWLKVVASASPGMVRSHEPFKFWPVPTISLERLIVSGAVNLGGRSVW